MKLKIMVPIDFTPVSDKAIEFLTFLMAKTAIETHFVHVIQVNEADWGGSNEASETLDHHALKMREQQASEKLALLENSVDFPFTSRILYGGLTTGLTQYASQQNIDLLIMGTKGATGLLEKISGSEAQQIVRHTQIPVITIHEFASISPIRKLLWVSDFKGLAPEGTAVDTILKLQHLFGAAVHLLQIMKPEDENHTAAIKENMKQFAETTKMANYELHLRRDYKIDEGVRNFNQESDMDMVVIGTHARSGFSQLFFGSVAETLVNRCIRPLLTYHLN